MPRDYKAAENQKRAKARRMGALARNELREPSVPRESPVGATSFPVKKIDMATAEAVKAFLDRRGG
jgi:hypothetical protein